MSIKSLPNILSTIRLFMTPLFIFLFFYNYPTHVLTALAVYIVAGITDIIDGHIARKYDCQSDLGKLLDPLADKFMQASAFVCLYITHRIPLWLVCGYFIKEITLALGALLIFKKKNTVVKSNWYGKSATVLIFVTVFIFMMPEKLPKGVVNGVCIFVLAYLVFAFVMYYLTCFKEVF